MASRLRKRSTPKRLVDTTIQPEPKSNKISGKLNEKHTSLSISPSPRKSARLSGKTEEFSQLVRSIKSHKTKQITSRNLKRVTLHEASAVRDIKSCRKDTREIPEIFGTTGTVILPAVFAVLSDADVEKIEGMCHTYGVKYSKHKSVSLSGTWAHLAKLESSILQVVRKYQKLSLATEQITSGSKRKHSCTTSHPVKEDAVENSNDVPPAIGLPMVFEDSGLYNDTSDLTIENEVSKQSPINEPNTARSKTSSDKNRNYKLCHSCGKNLMNLKRHNCDVVPRSKVCKEPEGELVEVESECTRDYTVLRDERKFKWYRCKVCPMVCITKNRIELHIRAVHTGDSKVPFNLLKRDDTEGQAYSLHTQPENAGMDSEITVVLGKPTNDSALPVSSDQADQIQVSVGKIRCTEGPDKDKHIYTEQENETNNGPTNIKLKVKSPKSRLCDPVRATEECERCGFRSTKDGIRTHMQIHHSKYMFSCKTCDKVYPSLSLLRSHYLKCRVKCTEGINAVKKFGCQHCGKKFGRNVDLIHHQRMCSDSNDPSEFSPVFKDDHYVCCMCDYRAKQRNHVVQHYARKHSPRKYKCDQCSAKFAYERELEKHRTVSHITEKIFKCESCEKTFATQKYLSAHEVRHMKLKKHFCPICNRGFLEKFRLVNHLETHKDKTDRLKIFPCTSCNKVFSSESYLRDHENVHTGNEPYSCKICGKTMKRQSSMWKHMQYHKEGKLYTCSYAPCKRSFRFNSALQTHEITHTGKDSNRCPKCGKVLNQKQSLQRHVCKRIGDKARSQDQVADDLVTFSVGECQGASASQEMYLCTECNKYFGGWKDVEAHMLWHERLGNGGEAFEGEIPQAREQSDSGYDLHHQGDGIYGENIGATICETETSNLTKNPLVETGQESLLTLESGQIMDTQTKVYSLVMDSGNVSSLVLKAVETNHTSPVSNNVVIQTNEISYNPTESELQTQDPSEFVNLPQYQESQPVINTETIDMDINLGSFPTTVGEVILDSSALQVKDQGTNASLITIVNAEETGAPNQGDALMQSLNKDAGNLILMRDLVSKEHE